MFKKLVCFIGGIGLMTFLIKHAYNKGYEAGSESSKKIIDDEYFADELKSIVIADWFKKYNHDMVYTNIILRPTKKNIEKYRIDEIITDIPEKCLFQCIYSEGSDKIIRFRLIKYNSISSKLEKLLEESNGIIIVKE